MHTLRGIACALLNTHVYQRQPDQRSSTSCMCLIRQISLSMHGLELSLDSAHWQLILIHILMMSVWIFISSCFVRTLFEVYKNKMESFLWRCPWSPGAVHRNELMNVLRVISLHEALIPFCHFQTSIDLQCKEIMFSLLAEVLPLLPSSTN